MEISIVKTKVLAALPDARNLFQGSDAKFATSLGINPAQYSRIKNGDTDKVVSDASWLTIARRLNVELRNDVQWNVAKTPMYLYLYSQLLSCKKNATSGLLCDDADTGKSFTAKHFARTTKNTVYVDCSLVKSKQKLVRFIAKEFGLNSAGRYFDVFQDLVYYIKSIDKPSVILDEAGDLDYSAFLEIKALWNATERACSWFMIGAEGLEEKIQRSIGNKKVGYTEIFSRFGGRYQRVTPKGKEAVIDWRNTQAALVIQANCDSKIDVQKMIKTTGASLRRAFDVLTTKN